MTKCANCGKELKWYEVAHPWGSSEPFCGFKCGKEYNNKKKEGLDKKQGSKISETSSNRSPQMKRVILQELQKEEIKRQTELELNGGNLTERDIKRQEKIQELEKELKPSAGGVIAGRGLVGGMALSMTGVGLMVVGGILTLTVVGAIIGIPLLIVGFILFIISGAVALLGAGSGLTVWIAEKLGKFRK